MQVRVWNPCSRFRVKVLGSGAKVSSFSVEGLGYVVRGLLVVGKG